MIWQTPTERLPYMYLKLPVIYIYGIKEFCKTADQSYHDLDNGQQRSVDSQCNDTVIYSIMIEFTTLFNCKMGFNFSTLVGNRVIKCLK